MRVNVYAEEMTDRVKIIEKRIEGQLFTGLRFYLELPASMVPMLDGSYRPVVGRDEPVVPVQMRGPFIHQPGDDDSSAVTFWGKSDLRILLRRALDLLDQHYQEPKRKP